MTVSTTKVMLALQAKDMQIARLASIAIGIGIIEMSIPSILPGIKPGLANLIVLWVAYQIDFKTAVWINLLRIFTSSLLFGSFLTPGFFLSLSGGLCALLTLYFALKLPSKYFTPVSVSLLMAFAHLLGQLAFARMTFLPSNQIVYFLPLLGLFAWLTGMFNAYLFYKFNLQHTPILALEANTSKT